MSGSGQGQEMANLLLALARAGGGGRRAPGSGQGSTDLNSSLGVLEMRSGDLQGEDIGPIAAGPPGQEPGAISEESENSDDTLPGSLGPGDAIGNEIPPSRIFIPGNRRNPQTAAFYDEYDIDASSVPSGDSPYRDDGASVQQLLNGEGEGSQVRPVNISELNMVSRSRGRALSTGERTVVKVSSLVLVTQLTRAATPISLGRFSMQIRDVEGHTVSVIVQLDPANLDPREFATDIARRFTPGTTVAMRNIIMAIEHDGYFLLLDMQDEDSEVFCCGDDALPPPQVAQMAAQCDHLVEMREYSGALACALESMDTSRDVLTDKVVPILTNLAIAHQKLGYKGVALAYAVTVTRLVMKDTPYKAVVLAASILAELKYEHAPHVLMLKSDTEGASKEVNWMHAVAKAAAQSHLHDVEDSAASSARFRSKGLQEVADALIKHESQWSAHSLGDVSQIGTMAEAAQEQDSRDAADALNAEGARLFRSNSLARAVVKWRAAIWLLFNKSYNTDLYYLWDILNSRHTLWEKAEATSMEEARADHYLDLCALAMLRASHVAEGNLQANLTLARCKLGSYQETAVKAAKEAISTILSGELA